MSKEVEPKKRFEVKMRMNQGGIEKQIFIDGELLDWSMDTSSLMEAKKMGLMYFKAAQDDVVKHFCNAVSETIGRRITHQDLQEAIKTGWI